MHLTDAATNWSFECLTDSSGKPPPGGLVLQSVRHDGHNFAKDIRTVGLWIATENVDAKGAATPAAAPKLYLLDASNFTVSSVTTLKPVSMTHPTTRATFDYLREVDAALSFGDYFKSGANHVAFGVGATFDAPALLAGLNNCPFTGLKVEQVFLFSSYGDNPKHEPSGALMAARCHPMIRYAFSKNAAFDEKKPHTRVASIRFDYRLHLYVDRHHDKITNAGLKQIGNQAGLFADSDTILGTAAVGVASGIWNIFNKNTGATAVSRGSFDAVEKPLALETMAPGIAKGFPRFGLTGQGAPRAVRGWDNIHWWGARGAGQPLISAPGAFHCAHLHWRWGAAAALAVGSNPHFNAGVWPVGVPIESSMRGTWGPLVDPGIYMQSIRVAVTKNDAKVDPARGDTGAALTKEDWKTLFDPGLGRKPEDISAGEDIVMWYSTEVHERVEIQMGLHDPIPNQLVVHRAAPGGTVFLHGIFFAHDAEKPGFTVGSTEPAYRPRSEAEIRTAKDWFRPAS